VVNFFKKYGKVIQSDFSFFVLVLVFTSTTSFFLGKISVIYQIHKKETNEIIILNKKKLEDSEVVASKKGKVYHFP
jgi:hypothetical protein